MRDTITPNAARGRRRAYREALTAYTAAVLAFRAAMRDRRAADAALAAVPAHDWRAGLPAGASGRIVNDAYAARPSRAAEVELHRAYEAAEVALSAVWDAREWLRSTRRQVRAIESGSASVVLGAAWGSRGLARVQAANRRRSEGS